MSVRHLKIESHLLDEINDMFDWHAAALLPDGRLLGRLNPGKRPDPNAIPDKRIAKLDSLFGLGGKTVLEVGCFEGIHTVGLKQFTDHVTSVDIRPSNVSKTMMRLSLHGLTSDVFIADAEKLDPSFGTFDIIFHFGVLYHLLKPVEHIQKLGSVGDLIYLDTHYCRDSDATDNLVIDGETYQYMSVDEGGWSSPFSGKDPTAIHLTIGGIQRALEKAGFIHHAILELRAERNGPRTLIVGSKTQLPDRIAPLTYEDIDK